MTAGGLVGAALTISKRQPWFGPPDEKKLMMEPLGIFIRVPQYWVSIGFKGFDDFGFCGHGWFSSG